MLLPPESRSRSPWPGTPGKPLPGRAQPGTRGRRSIREQPQAQEQGREEEEAFRPKQSKPEGGAGRRLRDPPHRPDGMAERQKEGGGVEEEEQGFEGDTGLVEGKAG